MAVFYGTELDNVLYGTFGDDAIYGLGGDDYLNGRDGNDYIEGGAGNDYLDGEAGNDYLDGGAGNDTVIGGTGIDTLSEKYYQSATSGVVMTYDTVTGNGSIAAGGISTTFSGIEAFEIYGSSYDDSLLGGTGNDSLYGNGGNDTLNGGAGNDILSPFIDQFGSNIVIGGTGIDTLGTDFESAISGVVMTYDTVTGNGSINGESISITFGGIEVVNISGSLYNDSLLGGAGNDTLYGGFYGNDTLNSGAGNDTLYGGYGNDILNGGVGNDTLYGGYDKDILNGGAGNDALNADDGNDILSGGAGNDALSAGLGNDTLTGARVGTFGVGEVDLLAGGAGADLFILARSTGAFYDDGNASGSGFSDYALITDFDASTDKIQLKSGLTYLSVPTLGVTGTNIFIDKDNSGDITSNDEAVAFLQGVVLSEGVITNTTTGFTFV